MIVPEPTSESAAAFWLFGIIPGNITICILQIKFSGSEWPSSFPRRQMSGQLKKAELISGLSNTDAHPPQMGTIFSNVKLWLRKAQMWRKKELRCWKEAIAVLPKCLLGSRDPFPHLLEVLPQCPETEKQSERNASFFFLKVIMFHGTKFKTSHCAETFSFLIGQNLVSWTPKWVRNSVLWNSISASSWSMAF